MIGIRFTSIGVLVALILLSIAVSPVHARMGMGGGGGDSSDTILGQINDIVTKYNGEHSGLMQAFSGDFGDTVYILVKKSFWSRSKYVYKGQIDSQGSVTVTEVSSGGMGRGGGGGYDCDNNMCITTTKGDVNTAYDYLMANSKDFLTLDILPGASVYELLPNLKATLVLSAGLIDEISEWIVDEYL